MQDRYFTWVEEDTDPNVLANVLHAYMPMLRTAEFVTKKYGFSREAQDEYALQSQLHTAVTQQGGRFADEIAVQHHDAGEGQGHRRGITSSDHARPRRGNRPQTALEGLAGFKPVIGGGTITAGNVSQLSEGPRPASKLAARQN
ncbi:hypothetical protein [Mesorhizobium sp.]|uniref:thiolase family protein n=1 Tax=Mesorhizobium sp. TaxID=1871066 RepID=UPI0011FE0F48|nr:hypothetical protein [Mesorhizobium sp.]TIO05566.1 MAG: hypothetical protein E5X88_26220 [Mesorhizobium sp.]TIO29448.1 MAG: hypothetical protein E5X89_30840 [Mesorhizobium sp.]TIP08838.1 MAG: hypothetical protein E5X73_30520 [Mesorhizobium sp.]